MFQVNFSCSDAILVVKGVRLWGVGRACARLLRLILLIECHADLLTIKFLCDRTTLINQYLDQAELSVVYRQRSNPGLKNQIRLHRLLVSPMQVSRD